MNYPPEQDMANVVYANFGNLHLIKPVDSPHDENPTADAEVIDATEIFEAARRKEDCHKRATHYLDLLDQKRPHSLSPAYANEFTTDPPPTTIAEFDLRIEEAYADMSSTHSIEEARTLLNVLREEGPIGLLTGARLLGSFAASRYFTPGDLLKPASDYVECSREPLATKNAGLIATSYLRGESIARSSDGRIIGKDEVQRQRALRKLRSWGLR